MDGDTKTTFGFSDNDAITVDSIKRVFKQNVIEGDARLSDISANGLILLKSIARSSDSSVLDQVFWKSIDSSLVSTNEEGQRCIDLCVHGFRAVTHKQFLKTVEKKVGAKTRAIDHFNFELNVLSMKIPYVKNLSFPSLRVQMRSSPINLNLKLIGESSFIFILFQLRKCLELFIKNLPLPLKECYLKDDPSATSTDGDDVDSSDSAPKLKKVYKRIMYNSSSSSVESNEEPLKCDAVSGPAPANCPHGLSAVDKDLENKSASEGSIETPPESGSPVFKSKNKEKRKETEMQCSGCALLYVSRNVQLMVESDYMTLPLTCTASCLDPNIKDAVSEMALNMIVLVSRTDYVGQNTIENFCSNFKRICIKILDQTEDGRDGFFMRMLSYLSRMKVQDANRVVTVLNEIVDICIEEVDTFEEKFIKNKAGRRNMISYLKSTGAIFSVIAMVETWFKMFRRKIDLKRILPTQLHFIEDMFKVLVTPYTRVVYHEKISNIARQVLSAIGCETIQVIELNKKVFRVVQTGRTIEIPHDLFIYLDKVEKNLVVFLLRGNITLAEKADLQNASFQNEGNKLLTSKWIFEPKNVCAEDILQFLVGLKVPKKSNETKNKSKVEIVGEANKCNYAKDEEIRNNMDENDGLVEDPNDGFMEDSNDVDDHGDGSSSNFSYVAEEQLEGRRHCVIETSFTVKQESILKYWPLNEKLNQKRQFNPTKVSLDWPKMYGGVCPIVISQNYVTIYGSRKTNANFGKVVGKCVICDTKYTHIVKENPFEETIKDGLIKYTVARDMVVDVEADGCFFVEEGEEPCIEKPVHLKNKARGLQLRGRERELLGDMAAQHGVQATHRQQMAFVLEEEIEVGNTTSMRSYPVIKMAKQEQEKKLRGGITFYDSARNVLLGQDVDVSPDFPDLAAAKLLPGMIRSLQEYPFKIMLSNFEMLRVGAKFLSGKEETTLYIDSSGKFWQDRRKTGKDLLNTALVLPPLAPGLSPFPIFEMISDQNKTQDFIDMLQHAFNNMALSLNNKAVPFPKYAVSDLSFPNIHALLMVCNKIKIEEYLKLAYECLMKGEDISLDTIVTICENHLLPAILKTARSHMDNKMKADTVVAGTMLVLRADTVGDALQIWESLVKVHCEKSVNEDARSKIKAASIGNLSNFEMVTDFADDTPQEEIVMYGNRRALRLNSDFYHLFKKTIDKVLKAEENVSVVTNPLYAPSLMKFLTKQYLSLFPLLSASVLNGGLKTNAHIELYWKAKRAIMSKVPTPQHWPAKLIGIQHHHTRIQAKEIHLHSLVPNLKFGGKKLVSKGGRYPDLMQELSGHNPKDKYFMPTSSKKERKEKKHNESYDGSKERWSAKKRKQSSKGDHYMKNKVIDHGEIEKRLDAAVGSIRITGNPDKGGVVVTPADIAWIMSNDYISDNAINACLLLLDKRLNEPGKKTDLINVYSISDLQLIRSGETNLVKKGKFICILPRQFGIDDQEQLEEQIKAQKLTKPGKAATTSDPGGHFTLISNLYCEAFEVNCYETFSPFRNQESLLTADGKKLIRTLFGLGSSNLQQVQVTCVNIPTQRENECGPLAFAVALQLCFHYPLGGVYSQIQNVREHFLECLQRNELTDFMTIPNSVNDEMLFTINI